MLNNHIIEKLNKLKLSGISLGYKEQKNTSGFNEMSFDDRLSLLIDREELERINRATSTRINKAKFKKITAFEDVKISSARGIDKSMIQTVTNTDWIKKKRNLIITGPSGCGKTFISTAIAHHACLMGFNCRYYRSSQLLSDLDGAKEEGKLRRFIDQLDKNHLLIIDDFFLSSINEINQKNLFELIEERHESNSTIFTSQNPVSLWHGLMPNPAIADAILDRITNISIRIDLKGESLRKKQKENLDQESPVQA